MPMKSEAPKQAPRARPDTQSPPERHPGKRPEEADPQFKDLAVRESGNRRKPQ